MKQDLCRCEQQRVAGGKAGEGGGRLLPVGRAPRGLGGSGGELKKSPENKDLGLTRDSMMDPRIQGSWGGHWNASLSPEESRITRKGCGQRLGFFSKLDVSFPLRFLSIGTV